MLFDFDFTLADSSAGIIESTNHALGALGRPHAAHETIRRCIGLPLPAMLVSLSPGCDNAEQARFCRAFRERADEVMEASTVIFAPAVAAVRRLHLAGVRTGIVSTKFRYRLESVLGRRGLSDLFDVLVGLEDVTDPKPHPAGLLLALERLATPPEQALYVGDHEVDAEAADRAGVPFVGVLTGMTAADRFRRRGVPCVADLGRLDALIHDDASQSRSTP